MPTAGRSVRDRWKFAEMKAPGNGRASGRAGAPEHGQVAGLQLSGAEDGCGKLHGLLWAAGRLQPGASHRTGERERHLPPPLVIARGGGVVLCSAEELALSLHRLLLLLLVEKLQGLAGEGRSGGCTVALALPRLISAPRADGSGGERRTARQGGRRSCHIGSASPASRRAAVTAAATPRRAPCRRLYSENGRGHFRGHRVDGLYSVL